MYSLPPLSATYGEFHFSQLIDSQRGLLRVEGLSAVTSRLGPLLLLEREAIVFIYIGGWKKAAGNTSLSLALSPSLHLSLTAPPLAAGQTPAPSLPARVIFCRSFSLTAVDQWPVLTEGK